MTKAELVEKIAAEINISKAAAAKGTCGGHRQHHTGNGRKGDKVTLVGFGTFSVATAVRPGREETPGQERDQDSREKGSRVTLPREQR